jgi:hypothetical protein
MSRLTKVGVGALAAAGAAGVAAALLTGAGSSRDPVPAVSPAAATASASSAAPAAPTARHGDWDPATVRARFEKEVPAALRADLEALRDVPADQRLAELERIRDAALAGDYGAEARAGAQRLVAMIAMLPPKLYADLEALVSTENAEIPDAVERIRDRALAGDYGPQVKGYAERIIAHAAEHGYDLSGDLDQYLPDAGD